VYGNKIPRFFGIYLATNGWMTLNIEYSEKKEDMANIQIGVSGKIFFLIYLTLE
jgi:hypothetical protein